MWLVSSQQMTQETSKERVSFFSALLMLFYYFSLPGENQACLKVSFHSAVFSQILLTFSLVFHAYNFFSVDACDER